MAKLRNTLADACVVIGLDKDTEFSYMSGGAQFGTEKTVNKFGAYKQHVLSVFTETLAYFPQATEKVKCEPFYSDSQVICPSAIQIEDFKPPRISTIRRSTSYTPDAKRNLPFSNEVINSLPTFCFPSGGYVYKEKQAACVNYLVLTNMEGLRTYAVSITYSCPFFLLESSKEKGKYKIANNASAGDEIENNDPMTKVYIPICVCLVSMHPFFNTMKECLSALLPQVDGMRMSEEFWRPIMKLTTIITTTPVPPPGPLAIEVSVFGISHVIYPADEAGRRIIDIDLQLPLLIFSPEVIVKIICCFLTQQRMIFMSSTYPLLTLIIEAFLSYIDPFKWRLTYVPVLPNLLGDLLEAPGPFIMGVHSDLNEQVSAIRQNRETPSIILVNIDNGTIDVGENSSVPDMPDNIAKSLYVRLRRMSRPHQIAIATIPEKFTYEEIQKEKIELLETTKAEIKDIFMDMLVSLFGDIFNYLILRHFDKNAYLQSRPDDERSFYSDVLTTDAFSRFVAERIERPEHRDLFAVLGERFASKRKTSSRARTVSVQNMQKTSRSHLFQKSTPHRFCMPTLLEENLAVGNFYRAYRKCLTKNFDELDGKEIKLKGSYLFLRGFANVACNQPIEGLDDFHSLDVLAPELPPWDYIDQVIDKLDPASMMELENKHFYEPMKRKLSHNEYTQRQRAVTQNMPDSPLTKNDFMLRAKTYKIATTPELSEWLFYALIEVEEYEQETGINTVSSDLFITLYKACLDIEMKSERNRDVSGVTIDDTDNILKVSPLINSMLGMGRLVITTHRLLFVKDGAREIKLVTKLIDIKDLVKSQMPSVFFSGVQTIQIKSNGRSSPSFYACLKEDRDLWFIFLNEMSTAQKLSEERKDSKIVDAAKNNILLACALLELDYPFSIATGACLYFKNKEKDNNGETLPQETRESLEMRLDPCVREAKPTTVMCMAYIPGNNATNESASIWCGMGSGAIMVYDTNQWNCVSELRNTKNRISCLSLVGCNQLWAGSFDTVIYVINTETGKLEQQLQCHNDFISDIVPHKKADADSRTNVWSSSINGQIVCWDPETRQSITSITLNKSRRLSQLIFFGDLLWCITVDKILVLDTSKKECLMVKKLIVYQEGILVLNEYALKINESELWIGSQNKGCLIVWNTESYEHSLVRVDEKVRISIMVAVFDHIWVGNKDGKIFVLNRSTRTIERELHAHSDVVRSMCVTYEGHIISGSASKEGKICVWNALIDCRKKTNFEFIEKEEFGIVAEKS